MITREQIESEPWLGNQREQVRELFEAWQYQARTALDHQQARQSETNRANELSKHVAALREALMVMLPAIAVAARDPMHSPEMRAALLEGERLFMPALRDTVYSVRER